MKGNILLGITGGIAAYKMVDVASRLVKKGFSVNTVMTKGGTKFVTPLTFQNITHNPVNVDLFTTAVNYDVKHISLAEKADLCLIGPVTANFIGKLANGIADDLLSTIIMATKAPVLLAPSMNVNMYTNPILQDNISYLKEKGYKIIEPGSGYLACGTTGKGRLPEPVELVENIISHFTKKDYQDKKILITAGPTREPLDPVRFLSNYSTGKMGYAIAKAAKYRGAEVTLITGPSNLEIPVGIKVIQVERTEEMYQETISNFSFQDILIMTAAVADYRPLRYHKDKIKKKLKDGLSLELVSNHDILAELGKNKKTGQIVVGFAVESQDLLANAKEKLNKKNLDMIIANDVSAFASDKNEVAFITKNTFENIAEMEKTELADLILDKVLRV